MTLMLRPVVFHQCKNCIIKEETFLWKLKLLFIEVYLQKLKYIKNLRFFFALTNTFCTDSLD